MTSQVFSLDFGAHSTIFTISPAFTAFASSCAWYFFERRTVFFSTGCRKVRSTFTITVLSPLSETTTPSRSRFGISLSSGRRRGHGAQHCLDAGDVLADLVRAVGLLELAGGRLEAQVELLLLQRQQRVGELIRG